MHPVLESIFGNRSATYTLLYLQYFGDGHAAGIANAFDVSAMGIQRQLKRLENSGVLTSRRIGRTRLYTFTADDPTVISLRGLLHSELARMPEIFTPTPEICNE